MLSRFSFAALVSGLLSLSAHACPDLSATGSNYLQVTSPYTVFSTEGIGGIAVDGCAAEGSGLEAVADDIAGHLPSNPTVVFDVQSGEGADLVISTAMTDPAAEPGEGTLLRCDTVMLVQSPDGTLAFSDDGGSANLSLVTLPRLAGTYKVWAGSYSEGQACEGEVRIADADLPCPALDMAGVFTAEMATGSWSVTAGGPRDVRSCSGLAELTSTDINAGLGFIDMAPTLDVPAEIDLAGVDLAVAVDAVCDTVLIGLDGAGNWTFSDDTGESLNPSLTFAAEGFSGAKVWVGTYDIAVCEVDLTMGQQADAACPNPNLPAESGANIGDQTAVSSDGSVDLSMCADALNGFDFSGYTSAAPSTKLFVEDGAATSLTLSLDNTCNGAALAHFADENGADVWEFFADLSFGAETIPLPGAGTYSFWLVNDTPGACSGTLSFSGSDLSCPSPDLPGKETYSYTLEDLSVGQRLPLIAGGNTDIANCSMEGLSASGTYIDRPDFVIDLEVSSSVTFEGEGQCDTTLLVHDGNGDWHFSDDDAPDSNGGFVSFTAATPGPFSVWVGTYGEALCEGALNVKRGLFKD